MNAFPEARGPDRDLAYAAGAAAWPALRVDPARFAAFATARRADPERTADLYLACALTDGVPGALAAFESAIAPAIAKALRRLAGSAAEADDLLQQLRVRLFVGDGARPAAIVKYAGSGSLVSWLRVVAVRMAIRELNRAPVPETEIAHALLAAGDDPELRVLKAQCRRAVEEALARAIAAIAPRDRELLRFHLVEGLAHEAIAPLYGVHRTTALRWLEKARAGLLAATRRELMGALEVGRAQAESVLRAVSSQLAAPILDRLGAP